MVPDRFFDALFLLLMKVVVIMFQSYIENHPNSYQTFKYLTDHNILEVIFDELIDDLILPQNNLIVTDTFTVPSYDVPKENGSYKYKGKKCCNI